MASGLLVSISARALLCFKLVSPGPPKKLMFPKYALVVELGSAGGNPRARTWKTLSSYHPSARAKQLSVYSPVWNLVSDRSSGTTPLGSSEENKE